MISVRKQMFYNYFLIGMIFLIKGIFDYLPHESFIASLLSLVFHAFAAGAMLYILSFPRKRKIKEEDDELSIKSKYHAGYGSFTILLISIITLILIHDLFSIDIIIDYKLLSIIYGVSQLTYFLLFILYDTQDELC